MSQIEKTFALESGAPGQLASSIKAAADAARSALTQAEKTLSDIRPLTAEDSTIIYQLNTTLKEPSAAARSIRIWADYLERHPEALIRGKGRK